MAHRNERGHQRAPVQAIHQRTAHTRRQSGELMDLDFMHTVDNVQNHGIHLQIWSFSMKFNCEISRMAFVKVSTANSTSSLQMICCLKCARHFQPDLRFSFTG